MTLSVGTRIGPYEILAPIGAGGMGEVYRAKDPRLGRDVAIKVLPTSFSADPDRLRRFEQEAKAAGVLNHPNITAVYDIGTHDGAPYVVQELLEGESLRSELAGVKLPLRRAIDFAIEIAQGLAAAHEKGIVHRDLKPENLFVTRDGRVKILDFGLAKLTHPSDGQTKESDFPTATAGTEPGVVLGTLGYMSPEQVRGQPADARSDIFALGAVLYEMLSGARAFRGGSAADTMSAILKEDPPDLSVTNRSISPSLERIVRHCLEKTAERRFQSARDLAFDLEALSTGSAATSVPGGVAFVRTSRRWSILVGGAIAVAALGLLVGHQLGLRPGTRHSAGAPSSFRQLTNWLGEEYFPDLSPDGQTFIYVRAEKIGNVDIWSQRVGGQVATNLTKECPQDDDFPALSPDGNLIAYRSDCRGGGIFLMGASGENARRLTNFGFNPAWFPDGKKIVFSTSGIWYGIQGLGPTGEGALWTADIATGRTAKLLEGFPLQPAVSPNASRIAFFTIPTGGSQRDIWTIPARGLKAGERPVPVTQDAAIDWNPIWSRDGRLLYFVSDRNGTPNLWRVSIDEESGRPQGQPEPVTLPGREILEFRIAPDGKRVIYMSGEYSYRLECLGLDAERGTATASGTQIFGGTTQPGRPSVSRDGQWIVFWVIGGTQEDLYIARSNGSELRKLTDDAWRDRAPVFSPDGATVAFQSDRGGRWEIWTIASDGSALTQLTRTTGGGALDPAWSQDGRFVAYRRARGTELLPMSGARAAGPPELIPVSERGLWYGIVWSPDGKRLIGPAVRGNVLEPEWLAYVVASRHYEKLPMGGDVSWVAFLPGRNGVVASMRGGLWLLNLESRQRRELVASSPGRVERGWAVSPDGKLLVVAWAHEEADIWIATLE